MRHDDTLTIKERLDKFRHRQIVMTVCMMVANLIVCGGLTMYYRLRERALIGYSFLKNSNVGKQIAENFYEVRLSAENVAAGSDAMENAGFGRNGFDYISRINGEMAVLITALTVLAAVFLVCIIMCMKMANSEAYIRAVGIEEENENLKTELTSERTFNELKQRQMQDFIENVAHQIKTPLSAISMKFEMIKEALEKININDNNIENEKNQIKKSELNCDDLYAHVSPMIDVGLINTFKIKSFIRKLLDISRLEAGKVIMASDEVEIDSILLESIGGSECDKNRIVTNFCDGGTTVYADESWLVEAFVNIINNCGEAVKNLENGKIYIDVTGVENQTNCVITVSDNGGGLSVEDFNKIFNRFETDADAAEFRFGIGMNLSKLIIESLHGRIKAGNSGKYGGAEFKIELPTMKFKSKINSQI
jgi:signal transduction histidine kinase